MANTESINRVLFDFNAIVDTDIGIAMTINAEFNNPDVINQKLIGLQVQQYKLLMLNRTFYNPMVMFINERYPVFEANDLYDELTHDPDVFPRVLQRSITTSIMEILNEVMKPGSGCEATVICWNQMQADYMKNYNRNINILVREDKDKPVSVANFDSIIMKFPYPMEETFTNSENIDIIEPVHGKNIYICRYRCNMKRDNIEVPEMTKELFDYATNANDIYVIDVYSGTSLDDAKEVNING